MLQVKSININEILVNNSRSDITLLCNTHRGFFSSLTKNIPARNILIRKVNYDKLEILIRLECLSDGIVQLQDEEGYIPLVGNFQVAKDDGESFINLSTEISYNKWIKFKSDILLISPQKISLNINNLCFEKIYEYEKSYESNVQLSLHKYCINLS